MKKLFSLIILALLPVVASAYGGQILPDACINGVYYKFSEDKAIVTYKLFDASYGILESGYAGDVVLPASVTYGGKTYSVTEIGRWAFQESDVTSVTIPESMTSIGEGAFSYCTGLTRITIPESVTNIGEGAFSFCAGLTSIVIPEGVTSIGNYTFRECTSLVSVTMGNGLTAIGSYAFNNCTALTSVDIPSSVTSIGEHAFWGCKNLAEVSVPGGVKNINYCAFNDCSGLTSLTIGDGVSVIGEAAFGGCSSLTSVVFPSSLTAIGSRAFMGCISLASIAVPESVTNIGMKAFENTAWFNKQPQGLVYVGRVAYKYKGDMPEGTQIEIKDGTTQIAGEAFYECAGLTSITLPGSVSDIGPHAFYHCTKLNDICLPDNLNSIGEFSFSSCSSLTSVIIPESVTSIGAYAFKKCGGLTSVTISGDVESIGEEVFYRCDNLVSVKFEGSVSSIGNKAFYACSSLSDIILPEGLTSLGHGAFSQCSSLKTVSIPQSVKSIGSGVFYQCKGLTDVTCYAENVPATEKDAFKDSTIGSATLYVPEGSVEKYRSSSPWSGFGSIVALTPMPMKDITFTKDQMATIILPTAPDASKGKYYRLDRCEGNQIIFEQELQPQARVPYIIVPSEDFTIEVKAKDLEGLSQNVVSIDGISFIGSYSDEEFECPEGFYIDIIDTTPDCGFFSSAEMERETVLIGALRAYLKLEWAIVPWDDPIDHGGAKVPKEKMGIVLMDEGTSIRTLSNSLFKEEDIYDLSGRKIVNGQLQRGIYIVNGKKVLMK